MTIASRIQPGETLDRMSAGRVDLPEAAFDGRLGVRLRIRELEGRMSEVTEASKNK